MMDAFICRRCDHRTGTRTPYCRSCGTLNAYVADPNPPLVKKRAFPPRREEPSFPGREPEPTPDYSPDAHALEVMAVGEATIVEEELLSTGIAALDRMLGTPRTGKPSGSCSGRLSSSTVHPDPARARGCLR
jgi:hypothetical protein